MGKKINWKKLNHSEGSAEDIPLLLEQLKSRNELKQKEALNGLRDRLCHQGTAYVVSANCVPTLITFLFSEECSVKADLLHLITSIGWGIPSEYLLYSFMKDKKRIRGLALLAKGYYLIEESCLGSELEECKAGVYALLCFYQTEILNLLGSDDERLRIEAMYTTAWLVDMGSINGKIENFLLHGSDRSATETATAIIAYWLNALHSDTEIKVEVLLSHLDSEVKIIKVAAALALAEKFCWPEAIEILKRAAEDEELYLGDANFAFFEGDLAGFAELVLSEIS